MDEFLKALGIIAIVILIIAFIAWQVHIYQDIKHKDYDIEFLNDQVKDLKDDVKYLRKKATDEDA